MISIKRITALILAAIMSFSVCAYAQEQELIRDTDSYMLLKGLGMIDDSFDGFACDDIMTRSQFAAVQARLMGGKDYAVPNSGRFVDVPSGSLYESEIYFLRSRGIINGSDEYRFRPNTPITVGEACVIAVNALGGGAIAKRYGGYIDGYMKLAQKAEIIRSADVNDNLTFEAGITMLENIASALVWIESLGGDVDYTTEKDRTLLAEYCGIYKGDGILTDNGITALNGESKAGEGNIIVNGLKMECRCETDNLIGRYTEYWYNAEEEELVYIREKAGRNQVLTIPADLLCVDERGFSTSEIVYYTDYESSRKKTARISANADMIYNSKAYPEFSTETLKLKSGNITLINNGTEDKYNVIIATEYDNSIVQSVDSRTESINCDNGTSIKLSDFDTVKIYDDKNNTVSLANISADDVITYAVSRNRDCIEIYVVSKTVTVKIVGMDNDISDYYLSEGGEKYRPAHNFLSDIEKGIAGADIPKAGYVYLIRLDLEGKIAKATEQLQSNTWRYAYYIGMRLQEDSENEPWFKLIMSDGSVFRAYPAEKVNIDDVRYKSTEIWENSSINLGTKRQIIKVRVNEDGDINGIQTPSRFGSKYGYDGERFSLDSTLSSAKYFGNNTYIMGKYAVSRDAMVVYDPDKDSADLSMETEDIEVMKASALSDGVVYNNVDIYDADKSLSAAVVVYANKGGNTYNPMLLTVDKVTKYVNADNEIEKKLIGVCSGKKVEYTEYKQGIIPDNVKRGDVARVLVDGNKIKAIDVMLSLADKPDPQVQIKLGSMLNESEWSNMFGYVYAKSSNALSVYFGNDNTYGPIQTVSLNNNAFSVTVYDAAEGTVYPGTVADIAPDGIISKDGGFSPIGNSMIFLYRRYENIREAVVVKY